VRTSPLLSTNIAATVAVALLAKPNIAWSGRIRPSRTSAARVHRATTSTRSFPETKSAIAARTTARTRMMFRSGMTMKTLS
jgi:hypothetical protein